MKVVEHFPKQKNKQAERDFIKCIIHVQEVMENETKEKR